MEQVAKKPKLESSAPSAPFPRNKTKKDRNSGSYLPKKMAGEEDFGEESFSSKTKIHSQDEENSPRKRESTSLPKKKTQKKASRKTAQDAEFEGPPPNDESNLESGLPGSPVKTEKVSIFLCFINIIIMLVKHKKILKIKRPKLKVLYSNYVIIAVQDFELWSFFFQYELLYSFCLLNFHKLVVKVRVYFNG